MAAFIASLRIKGLLSLFAASAFAVQAYGAESSNVGGADSLPILFDVKERLPGANLSAVPRVRFLMSVDFPPFNFTDQAGLLSGFHVDLAREICAELKIESRCQIQAIPFDELEAALEMGEGEAVLSGVAMTGEIRKNFSFTRPFMQIPARFAIKRDLNPKGSAGSALQGRKVGVVANSKHEEMLKAFFPKVQSTPAQDMNALYASLKSGDLDAIFADGLRLPFWVNGQGAEGCCEMFDGPYLSDKYLGEGLSIMTVDPTNILVPAFDQALGTLSRNGRLEEIYRRYFPYGLY